MKHLIKLAAVAAALSAQAASAANFNITLSADNGSRWYEYFSDVYAELGAEHPSGGDGFFLIGTTTPVGSGAEVFPNLGNFINVGSLTYDAGTGAVTGLTMDFDNYIADDDSVANVGYSTSILSTVGSVSLSGGAVSGINLTSNIRFTYSLLGEVANYDGTLSFNGSTFVLNVDDSAVTPFGSVRYRWDVTGGIAGLAPAVPEPSTYALMGAGLLVVGAIARRRRTA